MTSTPRSRPHDVSKAVIEPERLAEWAPRLEAVIQRSGQRLVNKVTVLEQTASTQDAARELGACGVLVIAGRQTAGRGRLGRKWLDNQGLGLACSIVLDGSRWPDSQLSLAVGLGVCRALESLGAITGTFGMRWPNDVVVAGWKPQERSPEIDDAPSKIAGVLIERSGGRAVVGVGINVLHTARDWPAELQSRAVSLVQLGSNASRIRVAEEVVLELARALNEEPAALAVAWSRRDMLVGRHAVFENSGRRFEGIVQSIDPASCIVLKNPVGGIVKLPALTTSMVHE